MNKTLLESQEGVLYFTSLALSMISTISTIASHSVQNPQTLQWFLSPLYICSTQHYLMGCQGRLGLLRALQSFTIVNLYFSFEEHTQFMIATGWQELRKFGSTVRPHKAHPSLTNCISAKVQPFQLLCRHTYNMKHIIYILQSFDPLAGPRAY